ncbi:NADH-quinone oxidoreductase subunit NuoN [Guyparkeria hydrothermalis]|uniref:NADH-quinone oxidoreductase subunit NuoN n=1 Tax=Guyparkeria hydrothermalis TaxID=923 RepID=UPI0020209795|nr:NADH-quinone oxidoreductase subunit NuoN [Guyparkeria hydrothermalis]MCL7743657.1 NADH-quinone oxidoreductase subunit NuoN [Guyparkeria hydrothermalis]
MTLASLNLQPVLPEIVLAAMACLILLVDPFLPKRGPTVSYALSLLTLVALFVITLLQMDDSVRMSFGGMVVNDPMADVMKLAIYVLVAAVLVMSRTYLRQRGIDKGEYYMLGLFGVLGMMITISSNHLLLLYLGLELLSLAMYAMTAFKRDDGRASEAAMKYFVLGALASGILLYGMSLLYGVTGDLTLTAIADSVAGGEDSMALKAAVVLIVVGAVFKMGIAPFHMWLPDVYEGAPTAVTLYLAAAPKIAALALVMRLLVDGMGPLFSDWQPMLIVVAMLSMAIGNVVAIAQTSFKRMLTYSTIGHVGFILLGVLAGTNEGYAAALFYTIAYAVMTIGGFGIILLLARQGFEAESLEDLKGLNDRSPVMAFVFLLLMFSMAGIPFTFGFWAKLAVLQSIVGIGLWWLAIFAVITAVIGAFYYLRAVKMVYFDQPADTSPIQADANVRGVLALSGASMLIFGLYPTGLTALTAGAFGL